MDSDDSDDDEFEGYVDLQDYTHSSIDVHIQDETTDDQDISLKHSTFYSVTLPSLALQWIIASAHVALEGLNKRL